MISLEEAQSFVRRDLAPLRPVELALDEVLGLVAAEQVVARERIPGFANSAMDGYALRADDTSAEATRLRVTGSIMAGDVPTGPLEVGETMRVMTGAPIPDDSDCVCMIEEVTVDPDGCAVTINRTMARGENVRFPGEDIELGQVLIAAGTELGVVEVGVLASQGLACAKVFPRPRVGVLSTGNELTTSRGPLPQGAIRDLNRPMLLASLRQSGFTATDLGIVPDDESLITRAFQNAIGDFDAVVSTGGVSVGDVDHVKSAILKLCGTRARSMQVAIKPGKPMTFGIAGEDGTPLFGLPGNPVSTLVSFELFVRPSLRLLGGHRLLERPVFNSVLDSALSRRLDGKLHVIHVKVAVGADGRPHVTNIMRKGSHMVSAIAGANALAMVPDGEGLDRGQLVRTMILDFGRLDTPLPETTT
ncbi:MAG TPA: gephyrin-like molybdotransferase Glp [Acidimicrobiales bacterium]|nr:gephyrin-like molybdotransferase Glp [Acidimicrobiales bacterium]